MAFLTDSGLVNSTYAIFFRKVIPFLHSVAKRTALISPHLAKCFRSSSCLFASAVLKSPSTFGKCFIKIVFGSGCAVRPFCFLLCVGGAERDTLISLPLNMVRFSAATAASTHFESLYSMYAYLLDFPFPSRTCRISVIFPCDLKSDSSCASVVPRAMPTINAVQLSFRSFILSALFKNHLFWEVSAFFCSTIFVAFSPLVGIKFSLVAGTSVSSTFIALLCSCRCRFCCWISV
mmetsp:Transcript_4773/g.11304  ORF Transcript_4773/g.11304 Transcript_4773/m.11304 type:complete len:234 (+) Transcript_4773:536-1237(+)